MQFRRQRLLLLCLLVCCAVGLTGCWDKKEFNKISMVSAMAVDKEKDEYILTVQIMMPKNLQEGGENSPTWILKGRGPTLQAAVDDLNDRSPRKMNWGHMNVVILGESALKEDIHKSLDFFVRGQEFRRRNYFLAAEGNGGEILEAAPELAELNTFYLYSLIEDQEARVDHSMVTLNDLLIGLYTEGKDLYLPRVRLVDKENLTDDDQEGQDQESGQQQSSEQSGENQQGGEGKGGQKEEEQKKGQQLLELNGGALIGDDHLLGWADQEWQKGYYWVKGRISGGSVTVAHPSGEKGDLLGIQVVNSKSHISLVKEDPLTLKIEVKAQLNALEDTRKEVGTAITRTTEDVVRLEEAFSQKVQQDILHSLEEAQKANVDAFGFGQYLQAFHPELAKKLDWDHYLEQLHFEVEVKGKLRPSVIVS